MTKLPVSDRGHLLILVNERRTLLLLDGGQVVLRHLAQHQADCACGEGTLQELADVLATPANDYLMVDGYDVVLHVQVATFVSCRLKSRCKDRSVK